MTQIQNFKQISETFKKRLQRRKRNTKSTHTSISSLTRMIPNFATVLALCSGLTSMRFAYLGDFHLAVTAILLAAVFDLMDGRLARMLGAASEFGAELDSLSDFVSFGAAPAMLLYIADLHKIGGLGWLSCLFFAVCSGFRLARFNILTRSPTQLSRNKDYFVGVPAPMGAIIVLLPLILFFAIDLEREYWPTTLFFMLAIISGLLMISKLPTFASKSLVITPAWRGPVLLGSAILITALYAALWTTLFVAGALYVVNIPIFYYRHKKILLLETKKKPF